MCVCVFAFWPFYLIGCANTTGIYNVQHSHTCPRLNLSAAAGPTNLMSN